MTVLPKIHLAWRPLTNAIVCLECMTDGFIIGMSIANELCYWDIYYDVLEKEAVNFVPQKGYELVQTFDDNTASQICVEINKQLETAYKWLHKFEMRNIK